MSDLPLEPLFVTRPKYSSCLYMTKTQEVFRLLQKRKVFRKIILPPIEAVSRWDRRPLAHTQTAKKNPFWRDFCGWENGR
jgi:hypothetical protein